MTRRDKLGPTDPPKIAIKIIMKKILKMTRRRYVKNQPKQNKIRINPFSLQKTRIMKQVKMMTTHLRNLDSAIFESNMSQSAVKIFCNKKLVKILCTTYESMAVKGNGGTSKNNQKSYVKGYGKVWFDERYITNILSLKNVKRNFRVNYYRRTTDYQQSTRQASKTCTLI